MNAPIATASELLALREFHAFEAHGARFLYMVPSAGIFRMDGPSVAILDGTRAQEGHTIEKQQRR